MLEAIVAAVCHPECFSDVNISLRDFDLSPQLGGAAYAQFLSAELLGHVDVRYLTLAEPTARVPRRCFSRRSDQLLRCRRPAGRL